MKYLTCRTFTQLFTIIKTIQVRCYGLKDSVIAKNFVKNPQVINFMLCNLATLTTIQ